MKQNLVGGDLTGKTSAGNIISVLNLSGKPYQINPYSSREYKLLPALRRYASLAGSRLFFNPCLLERRTYVPEKVSGKISPVRYNYPFTDIDSVKYILPPHYKTDALPKEINIETSFGKFISKSIDNGDGSLLFTRLLEIKKYSIAPEKYNDYRNFLEKVVKADRSQVVLIRK